MSRFVSFLSHALVSSTAPNRNITNRDKIQEKESFPRLFPSKTSSSADSSRFMLPLEEDGEMQEFFTTSLGRAIQQEISKEVPSPNGSSKFLLHSEKHKTSPTAESSSIYDSKIEQNAFIFFEHNLSSATRRTVMSGKDALIKYHCTTLFSSSYSVESSTISTSIHSDPTSTPVELAKVKVPLQLIQLLAEKRWGKVCTSCIQSDLVKFTTENLSRTELSNGHQRFSAFVSYLVQILPGWFAFVEKMNEMQCTPNFSFRYLLEACVIPSLVLLKHFLLLSQRFAALDEGESNKVVEECVGEPSTRPYSHEKQMESAVMTGIALQHLVHLITMIFGIDYDVPGGYDSAAVKTNHTRTSSGTATGCGISNVDGEGSFSSLASSSLSIGEKTRKNSALQIPHSFSSSSFSVAGKPTSSDVVQRQVAEALLSVFSVVFLSIKSCAKSRTSSKDREDLSGASCGSSSGNIGKERQWERAVITLQCDAFVTAAPIIHFCFSFCLQISSLSSSFIPLTELVLQIIISMLAHLEMHGEHNSQDSEIRALLLRQVTPAVEMISSLLQSANHHVSCSTLWLLVDRDFNTILAEALGGLEDKYFSFRMPVDKESRLCSLSWECEKAMHDFLSPPSALAFFSSDDSKRSATSPFSSAVHALKSVATANELYAALCSFPENEIVESFFNAIFYLQVVQRSAKVRFLRRGKEKSTSIFSNRSLQCQGETVFRGMDTMCLSMLRFCTSKSSERFPGVSCVVSFLLRCLIDLLSSIANDKNFGYTEISQVTKEEFCTLVKCGLFELLWENQLVVNSMLECSVVLYDVMYICCTFMDNFEEAWGTVTGEKGTCSTTTPVSPADALFATIMHLLTFLTDSDRLDQIASVKEGRTYKEEGSLLLFTGGCAVLAHALSHPSSSFIFFEKRKDIVTVKLIDKILLQSCLTLAEKTSHCSSVPTSLRWLIAVSQSMVLGAFSTLSGPLDAYSEVVIHLFDQKFTRNFGSHLLLSLLQFPTFRDHGKGEKSSELQTPGALHNFVWSLRKALQGACCGVDGKINLEQTKKVMAIVDTINRALCRVTSDSQKGSLNPKDAVVDLFILQNALCLTESPFWLISLIEFLKFHPCGSPLSFPLASGVFRCLFYLVKGNPKCRAQLLSSLNLNDIFDLCVERWEGNKALGHSKFSAVVRSFVHLIYENDGDPIYLSQTDHRKLVVLNPTVIIPVLQGFTTRQHFLKEQETLFFFLDYLAKSVTSSLADCFLVSQAGVLNPLSQLLLLCLSEEEKIEFEKGKQPVVAPHIKFLGIRIKLIRLMAQIAACHIDVRHLKQMISSLLINTDSATRSLLLPDVAELFSTSLKLWEERKLLPSTFIALRQDCERVGIRCDFETFPADGYSVSLWFCIQENSDGNNPEQTFFSILPHKEANTLIRCFMNAEKMVCVSFLNKLRNNIEISLGIPVPEGTWSHLVLTHYRPRLLPSSGEFQVQLNGKKVVSHAVYYPSSEKGKGPYGFYVGVSGIASHNFSSCPNHHELLRRQAQLVGQMTKIYFFPKPLSASEMEQLFYAAQPTKNPIPYLKDSHSKIRGDTAAPMKYHLGDMEKLRHPFGSIFAEKASILIDPRVSDAHHLYNGVDLLKGRSGFLEKKLEIYEGTLVVSGTCDILESLCLMGAVNGILIPMMVLLLDPSLPFPSRLTSITKPLPAGSAGFPFQKRLLSALSNLIEITMSFSSLEFMQQPLVGGGVFIVMSFVLEKLAPLLPFHMPTQLMNLCDIFVHQNSSLYSSVYSSLFFCSETIHALSATAQFHWWRCQMEGVSQSSHPKKTLMRAAGIQQFVAQEIIYNVEHQPQDRKIQDELFLLLDAVITTPATQSDATALLYLTVCSHDISLRHSHLEGSCTEVLFHVWRIFHSRGEELAPYLWKCGFLAALFPVLTSGSCSTAMKREALLMICLLTSLSKHAQRMMNPTLEPNRGVNVMHSFRYIELGWIGEVLLPTPFTVETYMTFRSAMTGDHMDSKRELEYRPLQDNLRLKDFFPHVLSPSCHLLQSCSDTELLVLVAKDMAKVLSANRGFPKAMVSFSGWFVALTEIYRRSISSTVTLPSNFAVKSPSHALSILLTSTAGGSRNTSSWFDAEALNPNNSAAQQILENYGVALGSCLLHVVLNESYGITEYREVCAYMAVRDVHTLLTSTLKNVFMGLQNVFLEDCSGHHSRFGLLERTENDIFSLIYVAEDYIFCSRFLTSDDKDEKGTSENSGNTKNNDNWVEKNLYFSPFVNENEPNLQEPGWMHLPLVLELLKFLTIYKPALGGYNQGSMMEWIPGYLPKEEEKKGRPLRVFALLLRVSASFVLQCATALESLIQIGHQYCDMIQWHSQSSLWSLRGPKKLHFSSNWTDIKCCSLMGITMSVFYVYHELVARRLELLTEGSTQNSSINLQLIQLLKRLFSLFRYPFAHLAIFSSSHFRKDEAIRSSTLDWFSEFSLSSSLSCDMKEYEVVRSQADYNEFVYACFSVLQLCSERQDEDLALTVHNEMKRHETEVLEQSQKASENNALIRSRLENYTKKHQENTWWPKIELPSLSRSSLGSSRGSRFSKASFAMRTSVWPLFQARIRGTMWCPAFSQSSAYYTRLSLAQQQSFSRRKVILESTGTNHQEAVRPQNAKSSVLIPDGSFRKTSFPSKGTRGLSLQKKISPSSSKYSEDEEEEEADVDILDIRSKSLLSSPICSNLLDAEEKDWQTLDPSRYSSFPCEVVYLMQCWSASLVIQNTELSIIIDEENVAKNPPTAKGAEAYVLRPDSGSFPLSTLRHIAPGRRYRMKHTALELLFSSQQSVMLNFSSVEGLNIAVTMLVQAAQKNASTSLSSSEMHPESKLPYVFATRTAKEPLFQHALNAWKSNTLSNFDYLMWINFFAGRSLNDLSQYPVFPWVLQNYNDEEPPDLTNESLFRDLKKPIGVCGDPEREESVRERYDEQSSLAVSPAHYMSHYSSSSVVTFFMIRLEPFTSLHLVLQGGMFDFPDRLFHSVPVAFQGVSMNFQNVRELIPEMYYLPELCINANRIPFGSTSKGVQMNDLILPPWAHGSPYEFIYRMREALESPYVSCHLHHWIDLIFGYKQTGKLALQSLNIFPPYSYEEIVRDCIDEPGMTDYVDNMGQTPTQLFKKSHPQRRIVLKKSMSFITDMTLQWVKLPSSTAISHIVPWSTQSVLVVSSKGNSLSLNFPVEASSLDRWPSLRSVTALLGSEREESQPSLEAGCNDAAEEKGPSLILLPSIYYPSQNTEEKVSTAISMGEYDPCTTYRTATLSFREHNALFIAHSGLFDHTVVIRRAITPGWRSPSLFPSIYLRVHHGRVTHMGVSEDSAFLVTGALDTTFAIWSCTFSPSRGLEVHFQHNISTHEDYPSAVAVSSAMDLAVTASKDGVLLFHSLSGGYMERRLEHPLHLSIDHILIQNQCFLPNILFASDADATIHQLSLNGVLIRSVSLHGARLNTWCVSTQQYLAVSFARPLDLEKSLYNRSSSSVSSPLSASQEKNEFSVEVVAFLHSFFLTTLREVELPTQAAVRFLVLDEHHDDAGTLLLAAQHGACAEVGILKCQ